LQSRIAKEIAAVGGWMPFDRFMELALYAPGLGYYANETAKFGAMPESGSDFVTAPEISPIFGQLVASQLRQALQKTNTREIWEFGAGTARWRCRSSTSWRPGALPERYTIVDLSGTLRAREAGAGQVRASGALGGRCRSHARRDHRQRGAGRHAGATAAAHPGPMA
jgi:SAM-dependent MidA family methyltransferase